MSVIQRRSTATPTIPAIAVLAVALIIVIAIATILYRKSRGPFRRSPSPALNLSTDQPTARPASWFQPMFPILPEVPRSPRPGKEAQNPPKGSELHNASHRNFGQPVPGTANPKASVQGSATHRTTRTTQPLPGTSSTVTTFKVPTSEPVRPLPPTPSKLPPVRQATPINTNGVPYLPQAAYISPSSTATATRTRTASNTPSPPPQQPHSANRSLASATTLRNPTSTKTLRNLFSTTTAHAPLSTFNSQTRTLRSPISDRDIQPAQQDHPALRHPASSPSLPHTKATSLPPTLLQPLPFPLTSDTTDLSTELAPPHEQANLGYKNQPPNTNTQTPPPPTQSQPQSNSKPSTSSRPLVNSTYANFLTTRMQTASSSSPITLTPHSASLAALLVGSEAGTTDAGSGDGGGGGGGTPDMNNNNNNNNNKRADAVPGLINVGRGCREEGEVEERCRRFRDTGGFADRGGGEADDDDDPVGRPWGRFDGKIEIVRGRDGDREGERDDCGGGIGVGVGVGPLRVGGKYLEGRRGGGVRD